MIPFDESFLGFSFSLRAPAWACSEECFVLVLAASVQLLNDRLVCFHSTQQSVCSAKVVGRVINDRVVVFAELGSSLRL